MSKVDESREKKTKTGGRSKGTPNKATADFRATVGKLLEDNASNVGVWLQEVANGKGEVKPDPAKALDLLAKLAEYAAPKLNRTEVTGKDGGPIEQVARIELVAMGNDNGKG